jgi:hypothetical protein
MTPETEKIIEELALLEHEQWCHWTKYMIKNIHCEDSVIRWERQMKIPYADLDEEDKEKDRIWARKIMPIIEKSLSLQNQKPYTTKTGVEDFIKKVKDRDTKPQIESEDWKLEAFRKQLELVRNEKCLRGEVTRDEVHDLQRSIKLIEYGIEQGKTLGINEERKRILKFINEQRDKGNMGKNIFNPGLCLLDVIKQISGQ